MPGIDFGRNRRRRNLPAPPDLADEIAQLVAQREAGTISLAEFDRRKAALLVLPERPEAAGAGDGALLRLVIVGVIVVAAIIVLSTGR